MRLFSHLGSLAVVIGVSWFIGLGTLCAQQPAADVAELPPPLTEYKGRPVAPTMTYHGADWLIRKNREQEEHCKTMLAALKLKPGDVVCDMGCGNGFYTLKMARLVGEEGRVLAVDIQPEMLHMLDLRAKRAKVANVEPIQSTPIDPKLPQGEVDLILLVDVYHEFAYPEQMLESMRESLKPTGRVALVEYRLEDPQVPIKLEHKMSKEQIMKEFPANGFKLVGQFDELPWQHLMFFGRDDAQAAGEDKGGISTGAAEETSPARQQTAILKYYAGSKEGHVGQAFQPDAKAPSGWKA